MKFRTLVIAAMVALGSLGGVLALGGDSYAKVLCPEGTNRPNAEVNSYAECNLDKDASGNDLLVTVMNIIDIVLGVVGIVAVVVIIIGGFFYMTATGEASKLTRAKNTIMYGIIGFVVAMLAFAIVNFVSSNALKKSADTTTSEEKKTDE